MFLVDDADGGRRCGGRGLYCSRGWRIIKRFDEVQFVRFAIIVVIVSVWLFVIEWGAGWSRRDRRSRRRNQSGRLRGRGWYYT